MIKFVNGFRMKFLSLVIGFSLALAFSMIISTVQTSAQQTKVIDQSTKIDSSFEELGLGIDGSMPKENYVVFYSLDGKKSIVPYSILDNDNKLVFRAPKTAEYELINNAKNFNDVKSEDVSFVTAREIFSGTDKQIFSPDTYMTRAMFAQVLANLDRADLSNYQPPNFIDVDKNSWYCPSVSWALSNNIIVSNENSLLFHPNQPITREQMASMLYRYSQNKNFLLWKPGLAVARPPFKDIEKISDYATDAVTKLNWSGVISGEENGNFEPKSYVTRAEACSIIRRFVERMTELN